MSLNKATLIGRLGGDPECRYSQSGTPVTNFGLATNEYFTKNGEPQERTEWHRIVCFGRLAEICRDNLKKGRQVYVEGRIQYRTWEDREGVKRYTTEIVANTVRFLGSKPSNQVPETQGLNSDDAPVLGEEDAF